MGDCSWFFSASPPVHLFPTKVRQGISFGRRSDFSGSFLIYSERFFFEHILTAVSKKKNWCIKRLKLFFHSYLGHQQKKDFCLSFFIPDILFALLHCSQVFLFPQIQEYLHVFSIFFFFCHILTSFHDQNMFYMSHQSVQEWTRKNLWNTVF